MSEHSIINTINPFYRDYYLFLSPREHARIYYNNILRKNRAEKKDKKYKNCIDSADIRIEQITTRSGVVSTNATIFFGANLFIINMSNIEIVWIITSISIFLNFLSISLILFSSLIKLGKI